MDGWERVVAAARRQLGLVTRGQVRALGVGTRALQWAVRVGRLERVERTLFRLPGLPPSWRRRALEALLLAGPDARLSHASAAHVWGFDGFEGPPATLDVTRPRGCHAASNHHVRVRTELLPAPSVRLGPLVVSSRAQTLLELAAVLDEESLEVALDAAHRVYPFVGDDVERLLSARDPRRTPGMTRLLSLVRERGGVATESALELRLWRRLRRTPDLPQPLLQYRVRDERGVILRVDFAWPGHRVAVHVDGFRWHTGREAFDRDASQRNRLAAAGWEELVVTSAMAFDEWVVVLRALLQRREPQRVLPFDGPGMP